MDDETIMVPAGWSTTIPVQLDLPLIFAPSDANTVTVPPGEPAGIEIAKGDSLIPVRGRP